MKLRFTKMQGAGNDFVVIDAISQRLRLTPEIARRIADRHFGIGCDQILLVEAPEGEGADFRYRIWNADGGEVEQCGNGARCFVRYVRDKGLSAKNEIRVETRAGDLTVSWDGGENDRSVWLTGPAVSVFDGEIDLDEC
ncbi:MAG: diaminopimelate epimerase [Betaproteobacteria bacterium]|nr:diaminopimelate epimerase [Betaproteobacteria bacterium]